ncbi:hypothetical protein N431DRAFT_510204 [Stipitochalara longipes BDJ]|nr:hypothetical protein N431DRAFT_510204 [Stipitochalara longipes BDJ]
MSRQEKRSRGKRPRYEAISSREAPQGQGFAPINYQSQSSPTFAGRSEQPQQPQEPAFHGQAQNPSQPQQQLTIATQAPPGKVAIPALKTPQTADSSKNFRKGRTAHACDYCRKAKAGCTGEQPCSRCRSAGVDCVYGDGKRVRDRKQMSKLSKKTDVLTQHNTEVTEALRRIRLDTHLSTDDMRAAIDEVLAMTPNPLTPDEGDLSKSKQTSAEIDEQEDSDESFADAEVGSTGSLDVINVDIDQDDTRATGHIGKSSSVAWAKRTAEECSQINHQETPLGRHDTGFTLASYHTEDADVEYIDTSNISPYSWPDPKDADRMVQTYFDHVHNTLPIVDKAVFMSKYRDFVRGSDNLGIEDSVWLAMANTVFAITSVYFDLTKASDSSGHQDHLIYCARAKMLLLDPGLVYEDARVATTSALGLLCLYFVTTCRLNRAWTLCGLAIRHGLTLGLHVRSEAHDLPDVEKEHRIRLWWSLYSLECILNELTGRPSCISDRDISTPLPLNMDEDDFQAGQTLYEKIEKSHHSGSSSRQGSKGFQVRPSATYQMPTGITQPLAFTFPVYALPFTSSTYFIYRIQLSIISHEIVTQLYCAATIKGRWSDVQDTIHRIDLRLLAWRDKLTTNFDITFEDTWSLPDWSDPNILARMGLAMQFFSSRMILFRPCLCRFEGRIKNQSEDSKDFNQEAVETCIHSARKMISLLSWSASNPRKLYAITPWWNTLHYICEALSVLMLEMAFRATHLPNEAAYMLDDAKKGVNWLAMMAEQSVSARKAWEIFDSLIRVVAPMIRWSVFDMPTQAPVPPGYNWRRFNSALSPSSQPQTLSSSHQPQKHTQIPDQQQNQTHQEPPPQPTQSTFPHYDTSHAQPTLAWQPPPPPPSYSFPSFPSFPHSFEAVNPLNPSTAISRFSQIGQVHGHYDDPWQHFFIPSDAASGAQGMRIGANEMNEGEDVMQGQMGPGALLGGAGRYQGQDLGGYGGGAGVGMTEGFGEGGAGYPGSAEGSSGGSGGSSNIRGYF